jgi:N utilization substance protein B
MGRKESRESAMKILFEANYRADEIEDIFENFLSEENPGDKEFKYISSVVRGALDNKEVIDRKIEEYSKGWKINRIGRVDLTILRLSIFELLFSDVPVGVVINEAVELAKKYGTDKSGAFINGILSNISKEGRTNS